MPDEDETGAIYQRVERIGVTGKQIGWHSFRHSLTTNLRSLGTDIKVAQELMRHSSSRTTLDVYTRAVDQQKTRSEPKSDGINAAARGKKKSAPYHTLGEAARKMAVP